MDAVDGSNSWVEYSSKSLGEVLPDQVKVSVVAPVVTTGTYQISSSLLGWSTVKYWMALTGVPMAPAPEAAMPVIWI